jgi:hypothetical protein
MPTTERLYVQMDVEVGSHTHINFVGDSSVQARLGRPFVLQVVVPRESCWQSVVANNKASVRETEVECRYGSLYQFFPLSGSDCKHPSSRECLTHFMIILYNPVSPAKFVISLRGNPCLRDDAASVEGQIL